MSDSAEPYEPRVWLRPKRVVARIPLPIFLAAEGRITKRMLEEFKVSV